MRLLDLLRSPAAYRKDWVRYAWNQAGHAYLVGWAITWFLLPWWAVLILFATWELVQIVLFDSELDDSLEDFGHVACGVFAAHFSNPAFLFVQAVFLASGIIARRRAAAQQ